MFERMAEFRRTFGELPQKGTSAGYYRWKAVANPFGLGALHLVEREGAIAGSASVTFKNVLVRGRPTKAAEIGDTYTNPDFRRQGIFSTAVRFCTDHAIGNGAAFIYGTPNDAALPGYEKKLGYRSVPGLRVALLTRYVSAEAAASRIRQRVPVGFVATALARGYLAASALRASIGRGARSGVPVSDAEDYPDADGAWGGSREDYAFFTRRDAAYLRWRFEQHPDTYRVAVAGVAGDPAGFVVTKTYQRATNRIGVVCDFVAAHDDRGAFLSLIRHAIRQFRQEGVDYAETWCAASSPYYRWLRELGFVERASFPVIVYGHSPEAESLLGGEGKWHFTLADSDNI